MTLHPEAPVPPDHPLLLATAEALQLDSRPGSGGVLSQQALAERVAAIFADGQPWMLALADRWLRRPPPPETPVTRWLLTDPDLVDAVRAHPTGRPAAAFPHPRRWIPGPLAANVPPLPTVGDLAAWLDWTPDVLEGHADRRHWHRNQPAFRDYLYRWHGSRLVEAPKDRLKAAQRRILREILEPVPVHAAAHGFVRGRSVHTHAALHAGRPYVLRFDLRRFFTTVTAGRVYGLFAMMGYPGPVAVRLTGLTTTWTPADITTALPWCQPHLPQGAPTSPLLANLAAYGLDVRLQALADAADLTYSRYADDLTFSGPRPDGRFPRTVAQIVRDEGFALHPGKTRIMGRSRQQRVTGLVVNAAPAVSRAERDVLKAVLHRIATSGWEAAAIPGVEGREATRAWLRGRIAWVRAARPAQGDRLLARFEALP